MCSDAVFSAVIFAQRVVLNTVFKDIFGRFAVCMAGIKTQIYSVEIKISQKPEKLCGGKRICRALSHLRLIKVIELVCILPQIHGVSLIG